MSKFRIFTLLCVALVAVSVSGCAMGLTEKYLGDRVATHDDDQDVDASASDSNNFSKDVR